MASHSPLCAAIQAEQDLKPLLRQKTIQRRITHRCQRCHKSPLLAAVEKVNASHLIQALVEHTPREKWLEQINGILHIVICKPPGPAVGLVAMLISMQETVGEKEFAQILNTSTEQVPPVLAHLAFAQIPHFQPQQRAAVAFLAGTLIQFGADVNGAKDTPILHLAAMGCNPMLVSVLLTAGAEKDTINTFNATAMDTATAEIQGMGKLDEELRTAVAQVLLDAGAKRYNQIVPSVSPIQKKKRKRKAMKPEPVPEQPVRRKKDVSRMFCKKTGSYKFECSCPRCTARR